MLSLTQVKTFLALVDEGNFHAAARRLGIAQPTVSQHIKKLEESVGTVLITRSHSDCKPTSDGEAFIPDARKLLGIADKALKSLSKDGITIGASTNIGTYILPDLLRSLYKSHRDIEGKVKLEIATNPQIADRITDGSIDLGLMEWWDQRPGYVANIWRREQLLVVVPNEHLWCDRQSISIQEVLAEPMIGGEPGSGMATLLKQRFGHMAEELQVSMTLGSTEAVKQAVRAGLGFSILLESAVRDLVSTKQVRALSLEEPKLEKPFYALVPEGVPTGSIAQRFLAHIQEPTANA